MGASASSNSDPQNEELADGNQEQKPAEVGLFGGCWKNSGDHKIRVADGRATYLEEDHHDESSVKIQILSPRRCELQELEDGVLKRHTGVLAATLHTIHWDDGDVWKCCAEEDYAVLEEVHVADELSEFESGSALKGRVMSATPLLVRVVGFQRSYRWNYIVRAQQVPVEELQKDVDGES